MADTPKKTSKKRSTKKKAAAGTSKKRSASTTKKTSSTTKKTTTKKKSTRKKAATGTKKKTTRKKAVSSSKKRSSSKKKTGRKMGTKRAARPRRQWPWTLLAGAVFVLALVVIGIDLAVTAKFEGKRWKLPAKVYGAPLELYVGKEIGLSHLENELLRLNYRSSRRPDDPGEFFRQGDTISFVKRAFQFSDSKEASMSVEMVIRQGRIQTIIDSDSQEHLGLVRLDPVLIGGFYPSHNEDRELVQLSEVPQLLIDALLLTEDKDFFEHSGVSFTGILRAMWVNVTSGQLKQGGSTITQQLVKNFYLNNERTISRKLLEAIMALLLEYHYSKEEILEAYLNEIYLGQEGKYGIHGFGLASRHYFDKPLDQLKTEEIALLVAIVKGASYYHPRKHPQRAEKRRALVLNGLHDAGLISRTELSQANSKPLGVTSKRLRSRYRYPAYMDLVKRQLKRDYAEEDLISEGLRIFTHLDPVVQEQAEKTLTKEVQLLEQAGKADKDSLQGAVVVMTPHNGEVVALVGDRNPRYAGFNRALDAHRPIGSVVKPAVYLAAIETSAYNFNTLITDEPIEMTMPDGDVWQPRNFDSELHGEMILQQALSRSLNLAAANLGLILGVDRVVSVLQRLGLEKQPRPLPSLLLGALEASPLEVAKLYQTMAANGFSSPLKVIQSVNKADGETLTRYPLSVERKFETEDIFALTTAMQSVVSQGTGRGANQWLNPELKAAGKTGTTDDQRDSWFAGFTGDYLTVSWLGRDDNLSTELTGSNGALKVWAKLMAKVSRVPLDPIQPKSMTQVWVDGATGALSEEDCENSILVALPTNKLPVNKTNCKKNGGVMRWIKKWWN